MKSESVSKLMRRCLSVLAGTTVLTFLPGCDSGPSDTAEEPATESVVFVSNYPLAYFAQRIIGNSEQVYFPAIDGDPVFWAPRPEDIVKIQRCNPIILNGATYEKWRKTVTLPKRRIVDTSAGFQDQFIEVVDVVTHQHGPKGDHSHGGTAFTSWIDFSLAIQQAQSMNQGFARTNIGTLPSLEKNLESLIDDLSTLDKDLRNLTSKKSGQPFVASHPIYQYFARAYSLDIQSVLWEPDVYPDEKQWQVLEKILVDHPAKWMLWEGKPLEKSVQRLKEMGLGSTVFDPCANTPDSGDFLSVMKQNIENLRPVFSP